MKQKYTIRKDSDNGKLTIQEFAELDKDLFSLICEESYENRTIGSAIQEGKGPLVSVLRTPNLYPIAEYADKIADSIIALYEKDDGDSATEIVFDDVRMLKKGDGVIPAEEDEVEIDALLDDEEEEDDALDIDDDLEDDDEGTVDDLDDTEALDSGEEEED